MKKYLFLLIVCCVFSAFCTKNDEEPYDPTSGGGGVKPAPSAPVISANSWAALADSLEIVLADVFMDKSRGTFYSSSRRDAAASQYLYWQQAHAMDVLVYAYERIKTADPARAATYASYMDLWFRNDAHNYNDSRESDGAEGHFYNDWIDDMAWIALTMMHMSEALGEDGYADMARKIYDRYIIPQRQPNGGLPWTYQADKREQNACTNAPSCLLAAKLYRKYKVSSYLGDAKGLCEFVKTNLMSSDYMVENPPLSYTQGTFAEACRQLFIISGDASYMRDAGNVLYYAFTSNRTTSNGILRHEGENDDQSLFKGILIPYTVNFILDPRCTEHSEDLKVLLKKNAETLYRHLDRTRYPQMYAGYYWGDNFDYGKPGSMGAHVSGTHLIEGVARMELAL